MSGDPGALRTEDCIFRDLDSLARRVVAFQSSNSYPTGSDRIVRFRKGMSNSARAYLERQTSRGLQIPQKVSDSLNEKIRSLENKDLNDIIVLLTAHQPNLFPYPGVTKKIALLLALSKKIEELTNHSKEIVSVFAFADHDFVHNKWVRSAELPAPLRRDGILRYNVKVPQKNLMLPANKIPSPTRETIEQWRTQTSAWEKENLAMAKKFLQSIRGGVGVDSSKDIVSALATNDQDIWSLMEGAYSRAETLAEFSGGLLSALVHESWEEPILFVNFSECFGLLGEEYSWMLENSGEFSKVIQSNEAVMNESGVDSGLAEDVSDLFPVWLKCSCGSKYRLMLEDGGAFGRCVRCGAECSYTSSQLKDLAITNPQLFEPRSIAMPIALSLALRMSCYVGGIGGLGYLMHSRAIAEKFGVPFSPTPVWFVEDRYPSIELLCSAFEVRRLRDTYNDNHVRAKEDAVIPSAESVIQEASSLSSTLERKLSSGDLQRNAVSEKERLLLASMIRSLRTNGCLLDEALNVGIVSTKAQWLEFLSKDGRLYVPIQMRPAFLTGQDGSLV